MSVKKLFKPTCFKISIILSFFWMFIYLLSPSFLKLVELKALDVRFRMRPEVLAGNEVVIVTVDDKSLAKIGRWPWPRDVMGKLVDSLHVYGVKAIGFDIVFAEKSEDGSDDRKLANAVARSGNSVLGYYHTFGDESPGTYTKELETPYEVSDIRHETALVSEGIVGNIPEISERAAGFGYFNIIPDADGAVRWAPMAIRLNDRFYPPLSLQTLRQYLGNPPLKLSLAEYGISGVALGDISIPVDEDGMMMVNYYGGQKIFPHYSASDVIDGTIPPEDLKDKIVLLGATVVGIYDMRITPFETVYPGVEIHATIIDNILHHKFVQSPQWLAFIDLLNILALGLLLGLIVPRLPAVLGFILSTLLLGGFISINLYIFSSKGIWLNALYPVITIITCYPMVILYRYMTEEKEKKWLKGAFQSYVTSSVMEELIKNPDMLKLGGEEKELTVLFSDIRGFTTISETLPPVQMVSLLNEYLTAMTDIVFEHNGYLDKYIGDAVMVVYGAPVPREDHPVQACETALHMIQELRRLDEQWTSKGLPRLDIGIGINMGRMVIGNMGSQKRFNYTVIGDSVNLASRLEGLNKNYGTNIIISESVYEKVKDLFLCRELDTVTVKGKTHASRIFELMGRKGDEGLYGEIITNFHKGLENFRSGNMNEASKHFEDVLRLKSNDIPSGLYIKRIESALNNNNDKRREVR